MQKGKIGEEKTSLLLLLKEYRLLTLEMAAFLLKKQEAETHEMLETLSDYGLAIKQFYECIYDKESVKSPVFYSASPHLPFGSVPLNPHDPFLWTKDLKLEEAMSILAFNQFHIALTSSIPKRSLQAQMAYSLKKITVNGRYRLKGKCYSLGYSHLMVLSVRDLAAHNQQVTKSIRFLCEYHAFSEEKMPWFILLCENRLQCADIHRKLKADMATREASVFFLLDTDLELMENPLHVLSLFRFADGGREIVSEIFRIDDWF